MMHEAPRLLHRTSTLWTQHTHGTQVQLALEKWPTLPQGEARRPGSCQSGRPKLNKQRAGGRELARKFTAHPGYDVMMIFCALRCLILGCCRRRRRHGPSVSPPSKLSHQLGKKKRDAVPSPCRPCALPPLVFRSIRNLFIPTACPCHPGPKHATLQSRGPCRRCSILPTAAAE